MVKIFQNVLKVLQNLAIIFRQILFESTFLFSLIMSKCKLCNIKKLMPIKSKDILQDATTVMILTVVTDMIFAL